jgi:hypothetical protein
MTIIYHDYTRYIPRLRCFSFLCVFTSKEKWNCHHKSEDSKPACADAFRGGGHFTIPAKASFTEHLSMTGIYQVYVCRIHSAARFLSSCTLPGLPGLINAGDPSDLDFLLIHSVLAKESPPIRGWGLPKVHIWIRGLLLSRCVHVWNGRGGVAARKEWHPPK